MDYNKVASNDTLLPKKYTIGPYCVAFCWVKVILLISPKKTSSAPGQSQGFSGASEVFLKHKD